MKVPVAELFQRLAAGRRILGVAVTPASVEVACLGPPYLSAKLLRSGRFLEPEELKTALDECGADAVVLGGSAAFRTDGSLQLGVRKLISNLQGLTYESDWLPSTAPMGAQHGEQAARAVPIWLCRKGQDDVERLVVDHVQEHAEGFKRQTLS